MYRIGLHLWLLPVCVFISSRPQINPYHPNQDYERMEFTVAFAVTIISHGRSNAVDICLQTETLLVRS